MRNIAFDRTEEIDRLSGVDIPYEYVALTDYAYEKWLKVSIGKESDGTPVFLDGMNEAKVFEWVAKNLNIAN